MTKKQIARHAVETLRRYQRAQAAGPDELRPRWAERMQAILEFTEDLGIKRAKIIAAVRETR